ncbi:MAG: pesticin C-terminus-like muramidase [Betaproteobacteria bacterium]
MSGPTPAAIEAARKKAEAAAKKAAAEAEQRAADLKRDQAWVDEKTPAMTANEKDELFRQASANCAKTTEKDGKIVLACPLPHKMQNCVEADKFECPNGNVAGKTGCKLSSDASKALNDSTTCIDGAFVSAEEGGSYLSPYVPWGPLAHTAKNAGPQLTTHNQSGVTIGTGVDLGAVQDSDAYLAKLQAAGVSQDTRDKIKPLLGKKKADACEALQAAKADGPMVFPQADVQKIDELAMKDRVPALKSQFKSALNKRIAGLNKQIKAASGSKGQAPDAAKIADLKSQIDDSVPYEDLTCAQQSVMFSSLYHEGSITGATSRPFVNALLSGDDDAAQAALTAKSTSSNALLAARGKQELAFFTGGQ